MESLFGSPGGLLFRTGWSYLLKVLRISHVSLALPGFFPITNYVPKKVMISDVLSFKSLLSDQQAQAEINRSVITNVTGKSISHINPHGV